MDIHFKLLEIKWWFQRNQFVFLIAGIVIVFCFLCWIKSKEYNEQIKNGTRIGNYLIITIDGHQYFQYDGYRSSSTLIHSASCKNSIHNK